MFLKVFTSVKNLAEMVSKSEIFQVRIVIHIMKSVSIIIIMISLERSFPHLPFDRTMSNHHEKHLKLL